MTSSQNCLIEAGAALLGSGTDGVSQLATDVALRVHDGRIAEIGPRAALVGRHRDLPRFGSAEMVAMPGLVNSHHHSGLTPLMLGVPFAPLELWLPQFRGMRQVSQRLDTLYSAIEMLESGTTTVHHIHGGLTGQPDDWDATTDEVVGAYGEIGMRVGFSFMIRDQNLLAYEDDANVLAQLPMAVADWLRPRLTTAPTPALMDFFVAAKRRWDVANPGGVRFNLAPANLHWCSDETLASIFDTARRHNANVHMHLVETERQAEYARSRFGHSAVAHLHALGCLSPALTLGHGNWMSRDDLDLLAGHHCAVCHNASSGLRLGSGIAPVNEIRRRGIPVALGIDQSNINDDRDMTQEMRLVWALHRETGLWNERPTAAQVLQMASQHGAMTAGFGADTGTLEVGRQADVVLMDMKKIARPFIDRRTPLAEAVLHRGTKSAIDKVFVGGKLMVDGGKVISVNRDAVVAEIGDQLAMPLTASEIEAETMVAAMLPALEAYHRQFTPSSGYRSYRFNAMNDPRHDI
jgi:5-methylthioadenosine/S-adenosylhomocysteine deaminase